MVAWLKGIARHRVQRAQRERTCWVHSYGDAWEQLQELSATDGHPEDEENHDQDVLSLLRDCLAQLTPATSALVLRYYHDDLTLNELADSTDRSCSGLAVTLCRARTALRKCLVSKGVKI